MSWVADAVATITAPSATGHSDALGFWMARNRIAAVKQKLRKYQPAAPAPKRARQKRNVERIDQRRPQELESVGQADQGIEPDRAQIHPALGHPDRKRCAGKRERQAGRKAEQNDDQHARLQIDRECVGPGGFGGG